MQKRVFLSNRDLINSALSGKHVLEPGYTIGKNARICTDYVLERKFEKSRNKLDKMLKSKFVTQEQYKQLIRYFQFGSPTKEKLIEFIETDFNHESINKFILNTKDSPPQERADD